MRPAAALLCALLFSFASAAAARADAPTILVDGIAIHTDVPPIVDDGHVLVPLRGVLERVGADVRYDAARDVVFANRGGTSVKIDVGTSDAWVDGAHVTLETPAREFGGRVEVPLRFIGDALGIAVDYDASTDTVVVVSGMRPGNFVAAGPGTPQYGSTASTASSSSYAGGQGAQPGQAPTLEDERPTPDALIGSEYPQIYARFDGGTAAVDPSTVRVLVDDQDVTSAATVSSAYVAYTPSSAMSGGSHSVDISGQSEDGAPFDQSWSFRIQSDMSSDFVSSVGFSPPAFSRFGFFPPGFSLFAPGPQFFFVNQPIVIVFFSPFFPNGTGFFTVSGIPGQFVMTPWLGCPGFFWGSMSVPFGVTAQNAVVAARFTTSGGRTVVVHSTAPLHIDGTRLSFPSSVRFAVRARLINHAATPRALVAFNRVTPSERLGPIVRHVPVSVRMPVGRRVTITRMVPVVRRVPLVTGVVPVTAHPVPVQIPRGAPVVIPRGAPVVIPREAPVVIPVAPRMPMPQAPAPVIIPKKPPA